MLGELNRAVGLHGLVVFDTFRWTPRRWPVFRRFLEESFIYVLARGEVEALIEKAGLVRVEARSLYLFSPLWQRKLPFWLLRALTMVERFVPEPWLLRTFWACTRDARSNGQ